MKKINKTSPRSYSAQRALAAFFAISDRSSADKLLGACRATLESAFAAQGYGGGGVFAVVGLGLGHSTGCNVGNQLGKLVGVARVLQLGHAPIGARGA